MKNSLTAPCPRLRLPEAPEGFRVVGVVNKISENACAFGSVSFELQTASPKDEPPKVLRLRTYPGNADAFIREVQVNDLLLVNFNITTWQADDKCRTRTYLNAYRWQKAEWK